MFQGAIARDESVDKSIEELQEAMKTIVSDLRTRDKFYEKELQSQQERLNRHRKDLDYARTRWMRMQTRIEDLEEENRMLKASMESMSDKLCRCQDKSPSITGSGSREEPFELAYEGSPPSSPSPVTAPEENVEPLPVPSPSSSSSGNDSNQENAPPACCAVAAPSVAPLVPVEEEDGAKWYWDLQERRAAVRQQLCKRSKPFKKRVEAYRMVPGASQTIHGRKAYDLPPVQQLRRSGRYFARLADGYSKTGGNEPDEESGSSGLSDEGEPSDGVDGPAACGSRANPDGLRVLVRRRPLRDVRSAC